MSCSLAATVMTVCHSMPSAKATAMQINRGQMLPSPPWRRRKSRLGTCHDADVDSVGSVAIRFIDRSDEALHSEAS